jgi:hypothetical protein
MPDRWFGRGFPAQRLEVLGEVVSCDEGQHVRLQALQVIVVEDLDGRILDRPVHAFSLTIGPRMVRFGQAMLDTMLDADAIEDMRT